VHMLFSTPSTQCIARDSQRSTRIQSPESFDRSRGLLATWEALTCMARVMYTLCTVDTPRRASAGHGEKRFG
jgi:hypothetical protein